MDQGCSASSLSGGGIAYLATIDSEEKPQFLCSALEILAVTRDAENEAWGRLIRVRDRDAKWHEWSMPMAMLAGNGESYRVVLLGMGLDISSRPAARTALHRLLTSAKPQQSARCVTSLARIMHQCDTDDAGDDGRASAFRPEVAGSGSTRCATRLGLMGLARRWVGAHAPPLTGRPASGPAPPAGTGRPAGNWSADGCGCAGRAR